MLAIKPERRHSSHAENCTLGYCEHLTKETVQQYDICISLAETQKSTKRPRYFAKMYLHIFLYF